MLDPEVVTTRRPPEEAPHPVMALIFHGQGNVMSNQPVFVTQHAIHCQGETPIIGAGSVLRDQQVRDVADVLQGVTRRRNRRVTLLPETLLCCEEDMLAWTVRGGRRPMWFINGRHPVRLDVPWPHLLFAVSRSHGLRVAALRSASRPSADTAIYHAPLMNVGPDGRVCTGNASIPDRLDPESIPDWEAVIFRTNFSHVNHPETLRPTHSGDSTGNADHFRFWRGLVGAERFPIRRLNPMGMDLGRFLGL